MEGAPDGLETPLPCPGEQQALHGLCNFLLTRVLMVQLESSWVESPEKGIWAILQVLFR